MKELTDIINDAANGKFMDVNEYKKLVYDKCQTKIDSDVEDLYRAIKFRIVNDIKAGTKNPSYDLDLYTNYDSSTKSTVIHSILNELYSQGYSSYWYCNSLYLDGYSNINNTTNDTQFDSKIEPENSFVDVKSELAIEVNGPKNDFIDINTYKSLSDQRKKIIDDQEIDELYNILKQKIIDDLKTGDAEHVCYNFDLYKSAHHNKAKVAEKIAFELSVKGYSPKISGNTLNIFPENN